jgi:hypothetical protein
MDLSNFSYDEVNTYLELNLLKIKKNPCVDSVFNNKDGDIYELIIIINDEFFEQEKKPTITYGNCYYYILKFNDETYYNELSVLDCGGYYIAVCLFKNKINITNEVIYNKQNNNNDDDDYFMKFHMNTFVGNKNEII